MFNNNIGHWEKKYLKYKVKYAQLSKEFNTMEELKERACLKQIGGETTIAMIEIEIDNLVLLINYYNIIVVQYNFLSTIYAKCIDLIKNMNKLKNTITDDNLRKLVANLIKISHYEIKEEVLQPTSLKDIGTKLNDLEIQNIRDNMSNMDDITKQDKLTGLTDAKTQITNLLDSHAQLYQDTAVFVNRYYLDFKKNVESIVNACINNNNNTQICTIGNEIKEILDEIFGTYEKELADNQKAIKDELELCIERTQKCSTNFNITDNAAILEEVNNEIISNANNNIIPENIEKINDTNAPSLGGLESVGISSGAVSAEDSLALAKMMALKSCIKEYVRIRPFLKIIDERATDLQLKVKNKKYNQSYLRGFQNRTTMSTNAYCIDFARVFEPKQEGETTTIFNSDGTEKPGHKLQLHEIVGPDGVGEIEVNKSSTDKKDEKEEINKINKLFFELNGEFGSTTELRGGTDYANLPLIKGLNKEYKAQVNGGIFNDMAKFQAANDEAFTNSAISDPNMFTHDKSGFIDIGRMHNAATWEKKASTRIQGEFAAVINPVTLDPIFRTKDDFPGDADRTANFKNKNIITIFYGASGSGKTHSSDAIILKLFNEIEGKISNGGIAKGFEIRLVSDYLDSIYDYNSTAANERYNDSTRLRGKTQAELITQVLGSNNNNYDHSKNPIPAGNSRPEAVTKFKQMVIEDSLYRATNGRTKPVSVPKPYFCEGIEASKVESKTTNKYTFGETNVLTSDKINPFKITNMDELKKVYTEVKNKIKMFRGVNDTGLNAESSRSHLIIILINKDIPEVTPGVFPPGSVFCLIDLAGTEDLNYLLPMETREKLAKSEDNSIFASPNWIDIPNELLFFSKQSTINKLKGTKAGKEVEDAIDERNITLIPLATEYIKMKEFAKVAEEKYKWIERQSDPSKIGIDDINKLEQSFYDGDKVTNAIKLEIFKEIFPMIATKNRSGKLYENTKQVQPFTGSSTEFTFTYDHKILVSFLKMMHLESAHINKSLGDFRALLDKIKAAKESRPDDPVNITCSTDTTKLIDRLLCPIVKSNPDIIIIGAINPRRSDDFNSYNTMKNISSKMSTKCLNTAAACN
jgi:hypothetical protein